MTDAGKRQNKGAFKKRAHRPWKSSLLQQTIAETNLELENSLFELNVDLDLDLDLEPTEDLDSFYPAIDFSEEIIKVNTKPTVTMPAEPNKQQLAVIAPVVDPDTKVTNKILLGGFFKTQQQISQSNLEATRKINTLLAELKLREHNTEANEAKVRQAMEQADIIAQQFNTAIEQANNAASAHQAEINLRKQLETQLKEEQLRSTNLQLELQNERQLRITAETEVKLLNQSATQLESEECRINDLQIELQTAIDKLMHTELEKNSVQQKLLQMQDQYTQTTAALTQIQDQHNRCAARINELQHQAARVAEFDTQSEKLKSIINSEQQLRKLAEQQTQEMLQRIAKIEERAKLATAAIATASVNAYDYEPDDLNY